MTRNVFTTTAPVGIVGHGVYLPRWLLQSAAHIKPEVRGNDRIPAWTSPDEDAITIAIEASQRALACAGIPAAKLSAIWLEPALEQPTPEHSDASILAQSLGAGPNLLAADVSPPCKSGSAALQTGFAFAGSGLATHVLAVGTERSGNPSSAASRMCGAAFVLGPANEAEAVLEGVASLLPEFDHLAPGAAAPSHSCRSPERTTQVLSAAARLMSELDVRASDVAYAVFHRASERLPREVWKGLGFASEQVAGISAPRGLPEAITGAMYWGLCAALDVAQPGTRILCVSHTERASHAFLLRATERLHAFQHQVPRTTSSGQRMLRRSDEKPSPNYECRQESPSPA